MKPKNPEYRVRSRSTYVAESADEIVSDRVIANLFHTGLRGELPIKVSLGAPEKHTGGNFKVPMTITLPSTITTIPRGDKLVGNFDVVFVVGNPRGDLSNVARKTIEVAYPPAEQKAVYSRPLTYAVSLVMRPGDNIVSVGVIDDLAGTIGLARTSIVAR